MAAATIGPSVELGTKAAEVASAKLEEFADDPIYTTGKSARKWGLIALAMGIGAYFVGQIAKKADQSYLNDMDNVLGIDQETPPTQVGSVERPPPQVPPAPTAVTYMNNLIYNLNMVGTTNAATNVAALQQVLTNLWWLVDICYGVQNGQATTLPISLNENPGGSANGLGPQLAVAIVECCKMIYQLEANTGPTTGQQWASTFWNDQGVYHWTGEPAYQFLLDITAQAQQPYILPPGYQPDWTDFVREMTFGSGVDFKTTVNNLCVYLNMSKPYATTNAQGGLLGVLGLVVSDLGGIGTVIEQAGKTVYQDLSTFGNDVVGFAHDTADAIVLIGKVMLNLPRLLFDSIGFSASWAVDMIANSIWMPLLIIGGCLIVYSIFAVNIYPRIRGRLLLGVKAHASVLWTKFDQWYRTPDKVAEVRVDQAKEAIVEATIQEPAATPPLIDAGLPAEAKQTEPGEGGGGVVLPVVALPPEQSPAPPAGPIAPATPPEAPVATPTAETEQMLGEAPSGPVPLGEAPPPTSPEPTPAELEQQEAARQETLPTPPPTYRERKAERDRAAAENMLSQLQVAFA